jgi:hypothetical protein
VKMDKDSNVIWKYSDHTHHDLDVADDGKIYVLTNKIRTNAIPGYPHLAPPRIDDYVVVLSPEGKPLKRVSILDALSRSPYGHMMRAGPSWDIKQDFLHADSIQFIDRATAAKLPFAKVGQVLLSLRDIDTIGESLTLTSKRSSGHCADPGTDSMMRKSYRMATLCYSITTTTTVRAGCRRSSSSSRRCSTSSGPMPATTSTRWRVASGPPKSGCPTATHADR